jgi:protein-tyrosine phosphatase
MAMGLFRKKVEGLPGWRIESAGTWTVQGQPAAGYSQLVLRERGIDIHEHRSRPVTRELLAQFNLILAMESGHKEALRVEFPEFADRVYLLSEMIGAGYSIPDPMGGLLEGFEETAAEFEHIFDLGFENILRYAGD